MTGSKLIGLVLAVLAIGGAAYFFSPGFRAKVDAQYDKVGGWTEEARRNDPVGYIEFSVGKLRDNVAKFEEMGASLRGSKASLEQKKKENENKIAFAEKTLQELKAKFLEVKGGAAKWPVEIAGKPYSEADLKNQVNLFLSQKEGFAGLAAQLEKALATADSKSNEILARISDSKGKLAMLETQKEIVKLNKLTGDTEKLLAQVQDVLVQNEAMVQGSAVRTVEELMRDAGTAAAAAVNPNVDAFLNG